MFLFTFSKMANYVFVACVLFVAVVSGADVASLKGQRSIIQSEEIVDNVTDKEYIPISDKNINETTDALKDVPQTSTNIASSPFIQTSVTELTNKTEPKILVSTSRINLSELIEKSSSVLEVTYSSTILIENETSGIDDTTIMANDRLNSTSKEKYTLNPKDTENTSISDDGSPTSSVSTDSNDLNSTTNDSNSSEEANSITSSDYSSSATNDPSSLDESSPTTNDSSSLDDSSSSTNVSISSDASSSTTDDSMSSEDPSSTTNIPTDSDDSSSTYTTSPPTNLGYSSSSTETSDSNSTSKVPTSSDDNSSSTNNPPISSDVTSDISELTSTSEHITSSISSKGDLKPETTENFSPSSTFTTDTTTEITTVQHIVLPGLKKLKLALATAFLSIILLATIALIIFFVKIRKPLRPYEELRLEP